MKKKKELDSDAGKGCKMMFWFVPLSQATLRYLTRFLGTFILSLPTARDTDLTLLLYSGAQLFLENDQALSSLSGASADDSFPFLNYPLPLFIRFLYISIYAKHCSRLPPQLKQS